MDPSSRRLIGEIVSPTGGAAPPYRPDASTPITIEQIVRPTGRYAGEERRPQGQLVAEVVAPPAPGGQTPHGV